MGGADGDLQVLKGRGCGDFFGDEVGLGSEERDDADGGKGGVSFFEDLGEGGEVMDAGVGFGFVVGAGGRGGMSCGVVPGEVVGVCGEGEERVVGGGDGELVVVVVGVGVGDDVGVAAVVFVEEEWCCGVFVEGVCVEFVEGVLGVGVLVVEVCGVVLGGESSVFGVVEEGDVVELVGVADDDGVACAVEEGEG